MSTETGTPIWHLHPLRVRYQETDQMGVVYYANYLTWFEIGRTEFVRHFGTTYREIEAKGLLLPVVGAECSYLSPARYDDRVAVCTAIEECSPVRLAFRFEVRRIEEDGPLPDVWNGQEPPGDLLVRGGTRHVWVNGDWRPSRLDKGFPELYRLLRAAAEGRDGRLEGAADA